MIHDRFSADLATATGGAAGGGGAGARPVVFVHTNAKQRLGARVAAHSFRRTSARPHAFDVRLIEAEDFPTLGDATRTYRRDGEVVRWNPEDLQSFTPLRFAVPDLMGHRGVALVVDPDVFAVGDVLALLERDRAGKAIWCRRRAGHKGRQGYLASSVMLLDCARLPHWRFDDEIASLWRHERDYAAWNELRLEDPDTIGLLAPEWNDFDRLTPDTRLVHMTKRRTQPWKTGLRVDFTLRRDGVHRFVSPVLSRVLRRYRAHPDVNQQAYFYALLADAVDAGAITRDEIAAGHVRPDSLALVERHRGALWPAVPAAAHA